MADIVLVHGAMHGGWCWAQVAELLRIRGHRVITPTLTGQGERRHLLTPDVGVSTHVEDITNAVWFEGFDRVTLVLHSYSGVLAGPLATRLRGSVERVVAAGGFLADSGQCLLDVEPPETAKRYRSLAATAGDGWRVPASDAFLDQWGVTDPSLCAVIAPRLTDFPLRCATEAVVFDEPDLALLPRVYIEHTAPPLPSLATSIAHARDTGWAMCQIATGHDLMLADPVGTADLITELCAN